MANLQAFERSEYQQVKADLHRKILDRLDLEKLGRTTGDSAREEVLVLIRSSVNSEAVPLSFAEREKLSREILDEIFGLGPLEPLLKDPTISDILVNRFDRVYVERAGKLEITGLSFKDKPRITSVLAMTKSCASLTSTLSIAVPNPTPSYVTCANTPRSSVIRPAKNPEIWSNS